MLWLKIQYRFKYYWSNFMMFCGYCPKCGTKASFTPRGKLVCNNIHCKKGY